MIESGLKYAKPDSIEFKAYYMQKRRKKRKEASQATSDEVTFGGESVTLGGEDVTW